MTSKKPTMDEGIAPAPPTNQLDASGQKRVRLIYPLYVKHTYPHLPFRRGGLQWDIWIFLWMLLLDSLVILWFVSSDAYFSMLTQWNIGLQAVLATAAFAGRYSGEAQRAVNLLLIVPVFVIAVVVMIGDLALSWNTDVQYLSKLSTKYGVSQGAVEFLNIFVHAWLPVIVIAYTICLGPRRLKRSRLGLCTTQKMACGFMPCLVVMFYCSLFNAATIYETNNVGNNVLLLGTEVLSAFFTGIVFWR